MKLCNMCLVFWAVLHQGVHSQFTARRVIFGGATVGDCSPPNVNTLTGLIPRAIFSQADGAQPPSVSISDHVIVCQATGLTRGTVGSFSAVVTYTCDGTSAACDGTTSYTDQFQFDCGSSNTYGVDGEGTVEGGAERTQGVTFTLDPPRTLEEQCGQCIQVQNNLGLSPDPNSHCAACPAECTEGQRWCTSTLESSTICCNWYVRDSCVVTCPGALEGDMDTFDCGCGELTLDNGEIQYSDSFAVDSVATHICDEDNGYILSGSSNQRTCNLPTDPSNAGWSGEPIECELHSCDPNLEPPQNGDVSIPDSTTFGSVVTYSCEEDFTLDGDADRICTLTGWTGSPPTCKPKGTSENPVGTDKQSGSACNTACIVGIVVAIIAVIVITALLVGVAYALYSYLSNPNTKLAKLDPNGINGVARDNPLYVDPDAVVGSDAVVGAEAA